MSSDCIIQWSINLVSLKLRRILIMSRSYRIRVTEGRTEIVCADDEVSTDVEILEILPKERMNEIVEKELEKKGFLKDEEGKMTRDEGNGVKVIVDLKNGNITVKNSDSKEVNETATKESISYRENDSEAEKNAKEQAQKEISEKIDKRKQQLQEKVTKDLENKLNDIRQEVNEVINKATGNALKEKARSMGEIKEITEDEQTGNLTIIVEV